MPDHVGRMAFREKLLKTVATRCAIFSLNSHRFATGPQYGAYF